MTLPKLELTALPGIPMVRPGDDIARLVTDAVQRADFAFGPQNVLVVAQKIVSKAEGRVVALADVTPGVEARKWAAKTEKDPRLVELILSESRRVVRHRPGVLIVEHRLGFVMANAGIDQSNVGPENEGDRAILLPHDPDASAAHLRSSIRDALGCDVGVVISDSFGRPFRSGTAGVAIGVAGLPALLDLRGEPDLFDRDLAVSISGFADEIAAAASLLMGQGAEGLPAVIVSGLAWSAPATSAAEIVRDPSEDLFR
jgi:coenzyme F420-0:L-glutamate ligase / coenzyme F420-1:gamma-L-glutamate ligase